MIHNDTDKVPRFLDLLDDSPITLRPADAFTVVCCSSWRDAAMGGTDRAHPRARAQASEQASKLTLLRRSTIPSIIPLEV